MRLKSYPKAIAQKQQEILVQDQQIRKAQVVVDRFEAEVEKAIAFNDQLKNELQRKVTKTEMLQDQGYLAAIAELQGLQDQRSLLVIELQLLQNQFTLGKLDIRASIALQEAAIAA
jgi:hypothetical protein